MTLDQLGARYAIRVTGTPIPQGSKTRTQWGMRDDNPRLKPWRQTIHDTATDTWRYHPQLDGPLRVWLRFAFHRPTSHYRTGRNAHRLRDAAPRLPIAKGTTGDIDKLARAVLDSLTTAGVWGDDAQVVDLRARKFYAGEHDLAPAAPGVHIVLEEVHD